MYLGVFEGVEYDGDIHFLQERREWGHMDTPICPNFRQNA